MAHVSRSLHKFPLYDELLKRASLRIDKTLDISKVCFSINRIRQTLSPEESNKYHEEIAALILHHDLSTNNGVLLSPTPYDGKIMCEGGGILHTITNFPPVLQQILAQYLDDPNLEKN